LPLFQTESGQIPDRVAQFFELAGCAWLSHKMGIPEEKRDLLKIVTSNRTVSGKKLDLELSFPFSALAKRFTPPIRCAVSRQTSNFGGDI
jgi:hypothetical protein